MVRLVNFLGNRNLSNLSFFMLRSLTCARFPIVQYSLWFFLCTHFPKRGVFFLFCSHFFFLYLACIHTLPSYPFPQWKVIIPFNALHPTINTFFLHPLHHFITSLLIIPPFSYTLHHSPLLETTVYSNWMLKKIGGSSIIYFVTYGFWFEGVVWGSSVFVGLFVLISSTWHSGFKVFSMLIHLGI